MKKQFPGYQPRTPSKLWDSCIFTFDASALLDLYRLTAKSRKELISIMERLKNRAWLAHQAALEYWDNRIEVIRTGLQPRAKIGQWAQDAVVKFTKQFEPYQRYQWLDAERWSKVFAKASEQISQELAKENWDLDGFEATDTIAKNLSEIFPDERIGEPYPEILEVYKRAEQRILLSIPPGFKDAEKDNYQRYGDVVLWFQMLDYAKQSKKPVIFITSDSKEDWWQRQNGKTAGPRPELIQEMHAVAGVNFHMYTTASFMEYAEKYFDLQAHAAKIKTAAAELRNIGITASASSSFADLQRAVAAQPTLGDLIAANTRFNLPIQEYSLQLKSNPFALPSDAIRNALQETFFGPLAQIRLAMQQFSNLSPLERLGLLASVAKTKDDTAKGGKEDKPQLTHDAPSTEEKTAETRAEAADERAVNPRTGEPPTK